MIPNTSCRVKAERVACGYSFLFCFSHLMEESLENYSVIGNHHLWSIPTKSFIPKLMPFILYGGGRNVTKSLETK